MYTEKLPSGRWRGGFRLAGRKITQTFDYQYEAEAWALAAEAAAARAAAVGDPAAPVPAAPSAGPVLVADAGPTVAAHAADWLERRRGRLEPGTVNGYRTHVDAITKAGRLSQGALTFDAAGGGLGRVRLGELRRSDVQRWITGQLDDGTGRPTINARLKVLRMIYTDAMEERLTAVNPAAGVEYLSTAKGPDRVLDRDEEARVLAAAPADLVAPILAGVDAGLRWQEVYALRASSILPGGYLYVSAAVVRATGCIRDYTKDGASRTVPVGTDRLAEGLDAAATIARAIGGPDAILFPNAAGGVMDYNNHRARLWRPTMRKAKITKAPGFHGLRHTYGTRLAAAGVPRIEIAELMGHADESTTKRYIHAGDDGRRLTLVRDALAAA